MPTKDSIRTSILSRKWEHLWTFSPKLDIQMRLPFCNEDVYDDKHMQLCADTFTRSVNNLFRIRGNASIENFRLFCWAKIDSSLPNLWIHNVLMCKNLTELVIGIEDTTRIGELPDSLFTCKTLVVVKIFGRFTLNLPSNARLPSLKTLSLNDVRQFNEMSIQNLLSGCPILEDFKLTRYFSDYTLIIDVRLPSLRRLTLGLGGEIFRKDDYSYDKFKVEAPILEFIELSDFYVDGVSLDISSHSIVEACFDFYLRYDSGVDQIEYKNHALALLKNFVNVTRLFLSQASCQILFCANETKLPMFSNLIQLEIGLTLEDDSQLLMDLLDYCPKLENLILLQYLHRNTGTPRRVRFGFRCAQARRVDVVLVPNNIEDDSPWDVEDTYLNNWTQPVQVPECLLQSLKSVYIQEYGGEPEEIGTVTYFLKNALVLEKMTISCRSSVNSENFIELDRSLAGYPKVSTGCQVKLLYPKTGE